MKEEVLISVVVRTCGRPAVLKNALDSIKKQTYKNIEIILVEDGESISQEMVCKNYSDLNIHYFSTGEKKGRSVVGNIGLSMCSGKYINFLDDDDIFYPQHIETLYKAIKMEKVKAAYSIAEEGQIQIVSEEPYVVREKRTLVRYKQEFNKLLLFGFNYIPIQSIMFEQQLYQELGGFDEKLDYLEDWDLWVRYSTRTNFCFVPEITSKYYVPYRSKKKMKRNLEMELALKPVKEKFAMYSLNLNGGQTASEIDYILNVYNKKSVFYYLKMMRNFILYREI